MRIRLVSGAWFHAVRRLFRTAAWLRHHRQHAAPIYPDEVIELPASEIVARAVHEPRNSLLNVAVVDGDWDIDRVEFERDIVYRSFVAHFVEGAAWKTTPYFEYLHGGTSEHGGKSDELIERRCAQLDQLFDYIRDNGYQLQSALEAGSKLVIEHWKHRFMPPEFREICVNVTRDGEFLLRGGYHRLSIAKILNLEAVPVRIAVRHAEWQRLRDRVASGGPLPDRFKDHPDLRRSGKALWLVGRERRNPANC